MFSFCFNNRKQDRKLLFYSTDTPTSMSDCSGLFRRRISIKSWNITEMKPMPYLRKFYAIESINNGFHLSIAWSVVWLNFEDEFQKEVVKPNLQNKDNSIRRMIHKNIVIFNDYYFIYYWNLYRIHNIISITIGNISGRTKKSIKQPIDWIIITFHSATKKKIERSLLHEK